MGTAQPSRIGRHRSGYVLFVRLSRPRHVAGYGPGANRTHHRERSWLADKFCAAPRHWAIAGERQNRRAKNLVRYLQRTAAALCRCHRALAGKIALADVSDRSRLCRRQSDRSDVDLSLSAFRSRAFFHGAPFVRSASRALGLWAGRALRHALAVFTLRSAANAFASPV